MCQFFMYLSAYFTAKHLSSLPLTSELFPLMMNESLYAETAMV